MHNSNTSNEPLYPPCPKGWPVPCRCYYCASETERIDVAAYGAEAAACAEEARLRTYLKGGDCWCCEARARLAALCESPDTVQCETSDGRNYYANNRHTVKIIPADIDAEKAIRPAAEVPPQS